MYLKSTILFLYAVCIMFVPLDLHSAIYSIPENALSIFIEDIDYDTDLDIVVGHGYNTTTDWKGITTLVNSNSDFQDIRSEYNEVGSRTIILEKFNNNDDYDIITQGDGGIKIFYDYFTDSVTVYHQLAEKYPDDIKTGDIDGDGDIDIAFYSSTGYFWGWMKNDGTGQFLIPEYFDLEESPGAIACGDLNGDSKDEVVVSGRELLIFYNTDAGFTEQLVSTDGYMVPLAISDINNDGTEDIIVSNWGMPGVTKELRVYSKNGENYVLSYTKWIDEGLGTFFLEDLNKDSYTDIIYNSSYSYPNSDYEKWHTYVLYNENGESFADPVNYQTYFGDTGYETSTIKSFVADVDGNTLKDIVALNYSYAFDNNVTILFQTEEGDFVQDPQTGIEDQDNFVSKIELYQNYPNPFNNETKIQFSLVKASQIELNIVNSKGEFVQNLVSSNLSKGKHCFSFKADDLNSGVYFYKLSIDGVAKETKKMLYLK